jgi:hypothetical protein
LRDIKVRERLQLLTNMRKGVGVKLQYDYCKCGGQREVVVNLGEDNRILGWNCKSCGDKQDTNPNEYLTMREKDEPVKEKPCAWDFRTERTKPPEKYLPTEGHILDYIMQQQSL